MEFNAGDWIVVESERVGIPPRRGAIEEVMSRDPLRVRVRWEHGSVSIFAPDAGSARVERPEPTAPTPAS